MKTCIHTFAAAAIFLLTAFPAVAQDFILQCRHEFSENDKNSPDFETMMYNFPNTMTHAISGDGIRYVELDLVGEGAVSEGRLMLRYWSTSVNQPVNFDIALFFGYVFETGESVIAMARENGDSVAKPVQCILAAN